MTELSKRQRDVLIALAETGDSDKLLGRRLGVASTTVKIHLREACAKVGAKNRTQAAIWAIRNQLAA